MCIISLNHDFLILDLMHVLCHTSMNYSSSILHMNMYATIVYMLLSFILVYSNVSMH